MTSAESPSRRPRPIKPVPTIDTSGVPVRQAETAADFGKCLEQVRILAGPLSNREIETRSGHTLRRTKISQVLRGDLPRRDFLTIYLQVCGVPEAQQPIWFEIWAQLAHVEQPPTVSTRRNARESATAIIEKAKEQAGEIAAQARADVEALMAYARAEAERARQADDGRVSAAQEERDSALARTRTLTLELETMHETSLERIRAADIERDAALTRAHDLSMTLNEMHESSLNRIRTAEDARDTALAKATNLTLKLQAAQEKIDELREKINQLEEAKAAPRDLPPTDRAQDRRYAPAYLVDDSDAFADSRPTTPPTIGDQR